MKRISSTTEYPWKKTRRFPIRGLSLLCSPIILLYALLGDHGVIENYYARIQLLILQEHIEQVEKENLQIHRNIQLVRSNPKVAFSYYQRNTLQGSTGTTYYVFRDDIDELRNNTNNTNKKTNTEIISKKINSKENIVNNSLSHSKISSQELLSLISFHNKTEQDDISLHHLHLTSDEFIELLDEQSVVRPKKIDTSTKVLGFIAGTVHSVQSSWTKPTYRKQIQQSK